MTNDKSALPDGSVAAGAEAAKRPRAAPQITTVGQQIAWAYANLARAHTALAQGCDRYTRHHHIVRARLYKGLTGGTMTMRSIFDDERMKMVLPQACAYCGGSDKLAVDHLIPRRAGGLDDPANLVWSCRRCNSAKGGRDVLRWLLHDGRFPSILVLRRYLKCMRSWCEAYDLLDRPLAEIDPASLPFALDLLPLSFPPLSRLQLTVAPSAQNAADSPPST